MGDVFLFLLSHVATTSPYNEIIWLALNLKPIVWEFRQIVAPTSLRMLRCFRLHHRLVGYA
jgi:hypothetical protein